MIDKTWLIWGVLLTVSFAAGAWLQMNQPPGYVPEIDDDENMEESDSPVRGEVDARSAFYSSEHEYHFSDDDDLFKD